MSRTRKRTTPVADAARSPIAATRANVESSVIPYSPSRGWIDTTRRPPSSTST
jgi:hypothetical protein